MNVLIVHWVYAKAHGGYSVFTGVGERTREGHDLQDPKEFHNTFLLSIVYVRNKEKQ